MLKLIGIIFVALVIIGWVAVRQTDYGSGNKNGNRNYYRDDILNDDVFGDDHNSAGDVDEGESP